MRRPHLVAVVLLAALAAVAGAHHACADDAAGGFSATTNPTGRWSYGYTNDRGATFTQYDTHVVDGAGFDVWKKTGTQAQVAHNGTGLGKLVGGTIYTPSNGLNLTPGANDEWSVIRWTAAVARTYAINVHFAPRSLPNAGAGSAEVAMMLNGAIVFDRRVQFPLGLSTASVAVTLSLSTGDRLDFAVGNAGDGNGLDVIGLDATVDVVDPNPGPAGQVFAFGGQRYAACKWGSVFESVAFDPVNRRIASKGFIRDLCGNAISAGPDEQPGLAWDSRTGTYWQVTNDRTVRRWSGAGVLMDTVFTIPLTFTVPTTGADTLESVRGIATDSTFVYLVDAGPAPGTIPSCEWFKFSRTGTPVKSSKGTNFNANLGPDPDALVDDICYVPFSSPVLAGRLVVALEHTGLQVIDTNGNFFSSFRWTDQGYATRPLAALTGIAIDPLTGNFYLGDNDTGAALVFTRIVAQGAASYTVGGLDNSGAALKNPTPGCDLPLWSPWGLPPSSGGNFFGLAYRPVDRSVYALDYSENGDLWRFDPRLGRGARVGPTGVPSSWSLAYDSERDVLYAAVGFPSSRIVTIDPASGAATSLPNPTGYSFGSNTDMAWNSIDKKLYVVDASVNPRRLLRIDRDTGIGTVVGNTTARNGGLDFDAATGKLQAYDGTTGNLVTIDPATGTTTLLNPLQRQVGYEGLAVIPIPANVTVAVLEPPASGPTEVVLAAPNPTSGATRLDFSLPAAETVTIGVYDVTGRRVRALASGLYEAGPHRVQWDGRDGDGHAAPSGVYFARVEMGARARIARLVIAR
jgi:flagellar hook capping protein FlgD/uncharacterized protein DUF6923